jgi:hypothetical protein
LKNLNIFIVKCLVEKMWKTVSPFEKKKAWNFLMVFQHNFFLRNKKNLNKRKKKKENAEPESLQVAVRSYDLVCEVSDPLRPKKAEGSLGAPRPSLDWVQEEWTDFHVPGSCEIANSHKFGNSEIILKSIPSQYQSPPPHSSRLLQSALCIAAAVDSDSAPCCGSSSTGTRITFQLLLLLQEHQTQLLVFLGGFKKKKKKKKKWRLLR